MGLSRSFSNQSSNSPNELLWDFGDGSEIQNGEMPTHTFVDEGTYEVCLTAINAAGEDTYCETFTIIGQVLSNNNSASKERIFQLFPNPLSDQGVLIIPNSELKDAQFFVYDLHGKQLNVPYQIIDNQVTFNVELLPSSIYFFEFIQPQHNSVQGKFSVQK